ncbi:CpaD family pilus assembly protein [Methylobacterium radiodurans]|uniref:Pilus assembly protein CpaD n=1 Tax=Methylobacterium radiodurans TaxID=2202828 RepID=A0A2U8VYF5_9HYPH|nr:CpaD family pilus assembly protein [Methylobacterium radiodurans]AWN38391.1 pilus assembly protein CpaD [Methylobacterium radiodurans]
MNPLLPRPTRRAAAALAVLVGTALGGCQADRATTGSLYPHDYRARHPIVLTDGTRMLDVFPTGVGHLDPRQTADIDAFVLEYRRYGRGTLTVEVPRGVGPGAGAAAERTLLALRRLAATGGVGSHEFVVAGYPVANPGLAAPVRLSFQRLQAQVADKCGLYPQDLGFSTPMTNLRNEPAWNLGCATQSNVAAQIADPIDLVRGRTEGRLDTARRVKDIGQVREGKDPSTNWRQDGQTNVSSRLGL